MSPAVRSRTRRSESSKENDGLALNRTIKKDPKKTEVKSKTRKTNVKRASSSDIKILEQSEKKVNGSLVLQRSGDHFAGCHVSAAGGVDNAIKNAIDVKATSFALFLRNQRSWTAKPLDPQTAENFRGQCKEHGFPPHLVLPHGSYLVNLGSPKQETRTKSLETLIDELNRCSMLGLNLFNIHPGSSCGEITRDECIQYIADGINEALSKTTGVKIVLENMSKQGNTIGGDFKEIRQIMDLVKDKTRIGVCIDTCHAMAAGYDLSEQEGFDEMMKDFEKTIGFEWLVALHLNDSKGEAGCHLDRHETIGKGKIGVEGFRRIMNCKHFTDIPLILETPFVNGNATYKKEIELLCNLTKN